jgi:1,4-alpha-glucan branching enzyme
MLYLNYARKDGEWTPNIHGGQENLEAVQFLQEMNATLYRRCPGVVTIAEESTSWPGVTKPTTQGGLGFGFKWNMGWMHDSLDYMAEDPMNRSHHHNKLTFSLVYAFSENFVLPISHDEVVHGKGSLLRKMPGDRWQQLANLRAFLSTMWAHPGKQLLFMGCEFGQESEWAESRELDWWLLDHSEHRGLQALVRDLNAIYASSRPLWTQDGDSAGFSWIDANDAGRNVFAFTRWSSEGDPLVCISNFAGNPHTDYVIDLPGGGTWREVLNTDATIYGGSGVGNLGTVESGHPFTLPPLGALWLVPAGVEIPG